MHKDIDLPAPNARSEIIGPQEPIAISESEAQYRSLLAVMAEGVVFQDADGRIVAVNPAAERILGCSATEVLGQGPTLPWLILREDGSPFPAEHHPSMVTLHTGRPQSNVVMGIRRADGTLVWISASSRPLFAAGESACHTVVTVFQDITQERQLAEALRQEEAQRKSLLEAIPNPFFYKDCAGRYQGCNTAFERYLGLSRDEIVGRTVYDISPKELADRYFAADKALFDQPGGTQVYEANVRWADGSLRDVIFHKTTLTGADGSVAGLTGIIVDITERKRMEQALSLREQQYRTLVEHSPDLIVRYDAALRRVYVNPAWEKASGLSAEEVLNVPMADIPRVPQPVTSEYVAALRLAAESGTRQAVEFAWVNARGETLDLQYVVVPERDASGKVVSVLTVGRDITEHKRAEEALRNSESHLRRVNRALRTLSAGNETLVRAVSEQELLERMCQVMVEVGGHAMAWISEVAPGGKAVELRAWAGSDDAGLRECVRTSTCRPLVEALERGVPLVVHDLVRNPLHIKCRAQFLTCGVRSGLILPLHSEGEIWGALSIYSTDLAAFDDGELALLTELGADLAYGIRALRNRLDREEGLRRIQSTMEATIQALASTVELRDPYTAGHQRRVAQLAVAIGRELGLAGDRVTGIYLAAIVHDIGKIYVPAEILTKPGRLSMLEFDLVKTHVEAGYDILKSIDFPWPIAEIVRQHHERMDGSGYPKGARGDGLLLESRILAVADVVEAIASFRPYRPELGIDAALAEIWAGRGVLFDGDVVDACTRQFRERDFAFE
jgi:PAS domain S-box-containing protein/putative nucleotidyltransferase with HDIG domain